MSVARTSLSRMSSPSEGAEQHARPPFSRSTSLRIIVGIAVMAIVLPVVILRDGVEPLRVVLAAGTLVLLMITAVQAWMLSTEAHLSRWSFRLIWIQLTVMVLLLVALIGGPIVAAVFSSGT
jgi:hypothetical protein